MAYRVVLSHPSPLEARLSYLSHYRQTTQSFYPLDLVCDLDVDSEWARLFLDHRTYARVIGIAGVLSCSLK